jgi:hypothetical protein
MTATSGQHERRGAWVLPDSGPAVARLFHSALGLVFVIAFASLAVQLGPLWSAEGLSPVVQALAQARATPGEWTPTLFWIADGDAALRGAAALGIVCGALALLGVWARPCLAAATILYMSFATVGGPFLSFQWDNLLLECGALALLLPRDRPAAVAHLLLAFLWFKLYFQSGLAKWWSPIGDWHDGSAMRFYYETAPLPGPLAWWAHHLPGWWHTFESRAMLVAELLVPPLVFCGRRGRLVALAVLTLFQVINLATANYGFFVWLALALHLFLLRDDDLLRVYARVPGRRVWGRVLLPREVKEPGRARLRAGVLAVVAVVYLGLSVVDARTNFGGVNRVGSLLRPYYGPLRVVNTYHLFAQITRVRVEPEFAGWDGATWRVYDMVYKPGPLGRAPPVVAPHQPRLDFQLWFYGLRASRPPPLYVRRLLDRLCRAPEVVQRVFATPLLPAPRRVRVQFWRYTFSRPGEPGWWTRSPAAAEKVVACP